MDAMSSGQRAQWRRWTVIVPGAIGAVLGVGLGTLGFFAVGFGDATACTDFNEALHACDGLYRWLAVGFIGQWVLVALSASVLVVGLRRPQRRAPASVIAWVGIGLAVGWYSFYFHGAYHAFNVHY